VGVNLISVNFYKVGFSDVDGPSSSVAVGPPDIAGNVNFNANGAVYGGGGVAPKFSGPLPTVAATSSNTTIYPAFGLP
jgi:hypothetical protein